MGLNNKNILYIELYKSISSGLTNLIDNTNTIKLSNYEISHDLEAKYKLNTYSVIDIYIFDDLVKTGRKMMMKKVNLSRRKHDEYRLTRLFYMLPNINLFVLFLKKCSDFVSELLDK